VNYSQEKIFHPILRHNKKSIMKIFSFKTEDDFLERFDGAIYSVLDRQGIYLCDLLVEDYIRLLNEGIVFFNESYEVKLVNEAYRYKVLSEAILIRPMYKK
jgi:hypothetical protein